MFVLPAGLSCSPTDLANFLACRHKTALDLLAARRELKKPVWSDPLADALRARGDAHEHAYLARLRGEGRSITDLSHARGLSPEEGFALTLAALQAGAALIVQAPLLGAGWFGYADILRRVSATSARWDWSYEVDDTKLSRETRGGTILQLCAYSELVGSIQGAAPAHFRVVTPAGIEEYRFDEFAAFYRLVASRFRAFTQRHLATPMDALDAVDYPSPTEHCGVCRWWQRCDGRRRADDHLSFVAGMGRTQTVELQSQGVRTLVSLAGLRLPIAFKPKRGARETYERLREQARVQLEQRTAGAPVYELLPIEPGAGLALLPEPSRGDVFLDLEGDPFAREVVAGADEAGGREYLFGLWGAQPHAAGGPAYTPRWATTDEEERAAFEATVDRIMTALGADPAMHVYHYAPYEPSALKRLAGRYATRGAELDSLLRGRRFVDLYAVVRRALRAGVETYSIKSLEPCFGFTREIALPHAGDQRRLVELALETGDPGALTTDVMTAVETYNKDDCRSAAALRDWLEHLRADAIARGAAIDRPPLAAGEASENVKERDREIETVRRHLLDGVPARAADRSEDQQAKYLLAYLLDWQYREDKVAWWEYFRLLDLDDDDLLEEQKGVAGLEYVARVDIVRHKTTGRPTGSVIDRYRYPPQELEIGDGDDLKTRGNHAFGKVEAIDRVARTIDVRKGREAVDRHPPSAVVAEGPPNDKPAKALLRIGRHVAAHGLETPAHRAGLDLLMRRAPAVLAAPRESSGDAESGFAIRLAGELDGGVLAIQGPPGSGKTYTAARMICALVGQGRRVGVTANSHKVIRTLLDAVAEAANAQGQRVHLGHKTNHERFPSSSVIEFDDNGEARSAFESGAIDVLGGTAWLWSREDFAGSAHALFVDEAGQMSLAFALAVSQAAGTLVLLGDPQQLTQPQQGTHPDGVGVSALAHLLGGEKTLRADRGMFLPTTRRLAPAICTFTSEMFYEGRLVSRAGLESQRIDGPTRFAGAGLFVLDVEHDGCRNGSDAEVAVVDGIVRELLAQGVTCVEADPGSGRPRPARQMMAGDILVVSPYNVQVSRLGARLEPRGVRVGTVDKFQGKEAPVVIYSMATSRPEDAPRGLSFLYSLNRLNVATSRARCACILVASPHLFEPDCRTPREMRLASALCQYVEMASRCAVPDVPGVPG